MTWPRKIFIDSTALFQLGPRLENVDFANLLEVRDHMKAELFITKVNLLEFLRFRKKDLRDCYNRIQQTNKDLQKYGQSLAELDEALRKLSTFSSHIDDHFSEKLRAINVQVLPLPAIDAERLLRMSIEGIPPFEKPREQPNEKSSEKGFRDALIMFTILDALRNQPNVYPLVITEDGLLADGLRLHSEEFGTAVHCVENLLHANNYIDQRISTAYRQLLRRESQEAKEALLAHRDALEAKISEIRELQSMDFGLFGVVRGESGENFSVERVLSLRYDDIEAAIWKERDQPRSRVLFRVRCEARVIVRNPYVRSLDFPKFQIGGMTVYSTSVPSSEALEKKVPLWFYGSAALIAKETAWTLEDLRIERSLPDREESLRLVELATRTSE